MTPMADLIIRMTADIARLQKDMRAARTTVDGAMVNIQRSTQRATRAMQGFIGAISIRGLAQLSDQFRTIDSVLKIATGSARAGEAAFKQTYETAIETGQAFESVAAIYRRFAENAKELRINQQQVAEATRTVAQSLALSGGSYQSTQAALLQFSQALASGVLRGQELNSVLEQAPRLARLIADGMQIPVGQLRTLAAEGKITAQVMLDALESQKETIDREFLEMPLTFARAVNNLKTAVTVLVGMANESTGAFSMLAQAIDFVARNLVSLANVITAIAIGAVTRMAVTYGAMAASAIAATTATTGLVAAIAGLGGAGPVGLIMGAAAALIYFSEQAYQAENSAEGLAEKLGLANGELERLTKTQAEAKILDITIKLAELEAQAISVAAELENMNNQMLDPEAYLVGGAQTSNKLARLNNEIANYKSLVEELRGQIDKTGEAQETFLDGVVVTGNAGKSTADVIQELIDKYRRETAELTMSNDEKERAVFVQAMLKQGIEEGTKAYEKYLDLFDQARLERRTLESQLEYIERQRQLDEERLAERIRQEEAFAREAQRINDQIGQSLTDALVEGGMNARDFLIKMFRTLVLRPLIQPIISGVLGAMGLGTAGAALAGGGTEGALSQATGLSGVISTLKGAVDMVTGGFAALGTSVSNLAVDAGFELMSMGFQDAGFAMIDASAALGTAASYLGGIAAGLTAGSMISGQFSVAGSSMVATGIGTAIGAAVGGPIGAAIGGAIGGVVNRAFGMGATTTEATGITGQMSLEGALAEQFTITKQKGGWFRSDKVRTSYEALEGDVLDRLSQTAVNVGQSVVSMAETLGLSAENLAGFNRSFILDFKGLSEEEISQRVQEEFGYFADALAETLTPELWNFKRGSESASQILTRLSGTLTVVNNTFDILGFTLYEASLAGADAAQKIIDLFGGVEQFTAATSFYYENFYSEQERANKQLEQMTDLFSTMGVSLPNTREGFRAMVEAAQAAGNPALVASLMQLAPAFDSLLNSFDSLRQSLEQDLGVAMQATDAAFDEVRRSLQAQLNASITAAKGQLDDTLRIIEQQRTAASIARDLAGEAISSLSSVFELLTAQIADLSGTISVTQTAMQARMFIRQALESARNTGYLPNADELSRAIGQARAGLGSEQFMTAFEQRRETLRLQNELIQLQELSGEQLTEAEKQLAVAEATLESLDQQTIAAQSFYEQQIAQAQRQHDEQLTALENQINELRGINTGIMSLADAMNALAAAIQAEMGARTAVSAATSPMAGQIAQVYRDVLERDPDPEGLNYWVNSGLDIAEATQYIIDSTENRLQDISKMYEDILGRAPDQAGLDYWVQSANSLQDVARYIEESPEARALRGFANGGYASPGMAIVGERGPELVDFQRPAMVYTNSELRNAMGGGDTAAELRQLRQETQAQSRAMVAMQARMTRVIEQWNGDGLPQERFEGATA